jgi:4-amino-4-deoxy-L-arabinose transferase-like glycosyltransferase
MQPLRGTERGGDAAEAGRLRLSPLERCAWIGILALGAAVRLSQLASRPIWDDEAWTYHVSGQGLAHLHTMVVHDAHPYLYYLLQAWIIQAAGASTVAMRLPSAIAGIVLIGVAGWIATRLWGVRTGLLAGALVALFPVLVYQSVEARSYSILTLLLTLGAWCHWRHLEEPSGRRGAAAAVLTLLAAHTHYFGGLLIPFALAAALVQRRPPHQVRYWWPSLVAVLGVLPLGLLYAAQRPYLRLTAGVVESDAVLPTHLLLIRGLLVQGIGPYWDGPLKLAGYLVFGGIAVITVTVLALDPVRRKQARFAALFAVVIIGLEWAIQFLNMGRVRDSYLSTQSVPICLLLAAGLMSERLRKLRAGAACALLSVPLLGTMLLSFAHGRWNPDFRAAARRVGTVEADGVLFARHFGDLICYRFYDARREPLAKLPSDSFSLEDLVARVVKTDAGQLISTSRALWVIGKYPSGKAGFEDWAARLTQAGYRPGEERNLDGARMVLWSRGEAARLGSRPRSRPPSESLRSPSRPRLAAWPGPLAVNRRPDAAK